MVPFYTELSADWRCILKTFRTIFWTVYLQLCTSEHESSTLQRLVIAGFVMTYHYINKHISLRAMTIGLEDVKRIFQRLSQHLEEEADRQTKELVRPPDQTENEFVEQVSVARKNAFRITLTISGSDGEDLFGDDLTLFESPNLPDAIRYIYMTNTVAYQGQTGRKPSNGFALTLDFRKPPLVDNNNPVSNPTQNDSHLNIEGDRDSWVASISEAVMGILDKRRNGRHFLHAAFVYDFGLMVVGLPLGLYLCWRLSALIDSNLGSHSNFLAAVAYFYLVLMGVWMYRILFGYSKWAFPTIELRECEDRSRTHRWFWGAIIMGIIGKAAYDVAQATILK
jgi:hypothetical protein